MFGNRKRIDRLEAEIAALRSALRSEEDERRRVIAEERNRAQEDIKCLYAWIETLRKDLAEERKNAQEETKRLFEEVETLRKALSETKKEMSDMRTLRGMTTVPEAPVSISDVMDEWLNGKEDALENE